MPVGPEQEAELLSRVLVSRSAASRAQVDAAREDATRRGGRFATVLFESGAVDLPSLASALAEVHGLAAAGPEALDVPPEVVALLPGKVAIRALAFPVRREGSGVRVAFADPWDEAAIAAVRREIPDARVAVAPEPVVYAVLRSRYSLARVPAPLADLVDEILESREARTRRRGAVPRDDSDYVTTPGVLPSMPDEVSTVVQRDPEDVTSPEEILWSDTLEETTRTLESESDRERIVDALLVWSRTSRANALVLAREGSAFRGLGGSGDLEGMTATVEPGAPTLLDAALAGESGYAGAPPRTKGNDALLSRLGRTPLEVLALPLCRKKGSELVLWVDGGERGLDEDVAKRFRDLARLARRTLEKA